jgi:hypothetical protein
MAQTECCHNCVFAWRDLRLTVLGMRARMPIGPMCANQPGHFGVPTITRIGRICLNYRPKPPEPKGEHVKQIILTNGMVAYVDAADYEELNRYTWQLVSAGYAARHEKGKWVFMHRQIMNPPEGMQVDHIHRNRLDNTRAHLRICTASENARNRGKRADASSRFIGVSYDKKRKKWLAYIRLERKLRQIGAYGDEIEAARAHDYAAVLHHGDFARLNFPEEWPPERRAEVRAQRDAEAAAANPDSPSSNVEDQEQKTQDAERTTKADDPAQSGPQVTS